MELLGRASWWLPVWLARLLPDLNVEGAGVFDDARDAQAGPASVV